MKTEKLMPSKTDKAVSVFEPKTFDELMARADAIVRSGILPTSINTKEKFVTVVVSGRELGLSMMESCRSIYPVNGTPTLRPQTMLALIKRSGLEESISIKDQVLYCSVTMKRKGAESYTTVFGDTEAKAMGLAEKDNYRKQAKTMYRWRAIAACARIVYPDVIMGYYTPEEVEPDVVILDPETPGERIEVPAKSDPTVKTGVTTDAGKDIPLNELTNDTVGGFKLKLLGVADFEGKDSRFDGLPLDEIFHYTVGGDRNVGYGFLLKAEANYPVLDVRDVIRRYLDLRDPDRHASVPQAPKSSQFEAVDPKEAKATTKQVEALHKVCANKDIDLAGLCFGEKIDHKTLTQAQAGRLLKKYGAQR